MNRRKFIIAVTAIAFVVTASGCADFLQKNDTYSIAPEVSDVFSDIAEQTSDTDTTDFVSVIEDTIDIESEPETDSAEEEVFADITSVFSTDSDNYTDSEPVENSDTDSEVKLYDSGNSDWSLILVNKYNPIPEDYEFDLITLDNGVSVDSRVYPALQEMFDDARAEGIYPSVTEGFRTTEYQQEIMQERIDEYIAEGYSEEEAESLAKNWVAEPGTSEHELGLALDINGDGVNSSSEEVYVWLAENAYKYGFILRYPAGKEDITGIDYEPWHYRYVGNTAEEIYTLGITLEEYLAN